jgi:hypothetical protein
MYGIAMLGNELPIVLFTTKIIVESTNGNFFDYVTISLGPILWGIKLTFGQLYGLSLSSAAQDMIICAGLSLMFVA